MRKNATTASAGEKAEAFPAHALPRLLYLGDAPVEASYHGSALLFRLLQSYPVEKLRIVETGISVSEPERRLPEVCYANFTLSKSRWLNTRAHRWVSSYYTLSARRRAQSIPMSIAEFKADAVLTVAHGYGWLTAAHYAQEHRLPLHLIVHDDWPRVADFLEPGRIWLDKKFGAVYRQAVSRFCVSPLMREEYRQHYAADGLVLYPSRAMDCREAKEPPQRIIRRDQPFTVAYGGSINSTGYVRALTNLARALEPFDGRLLIFAPLTPDAIQSTGLARSNVTFRGLVNSEELLTYFRNEADALFVPMSFEPGDRRNMEIAFPSKLTDYTATGLPLLIFAPNYSSVVQWAWENQGVAEVVLEDSHEALGKSVERLIKSPLLRKSLGQRALEVGTQYFGYDSAMERFLKPIIQGTSGANSKIRP